jgi:hypothetical protein
MLFIQRDDLVEDFSPATSHPYFRNSILLTRFYARPFGLQSRCLQEGDHFVIECRISIEDGISIWTRFGESFAQLLDDPLRCRVVSDVEVQNPAPSMLEHEKAVEQPECHCRHREEIERRNHLTMILQKCQPALGRVAATPHASQIPRHTPLRNDDAEFLKLAVDFGAPQP